MTDEELLAINEPTAIPPANLRPGSGTLMDQFADPAVAQALYGQPMPEIDLTVDPNVVQPLPQSAVVPAAPVMPVPAVNLPDPLAAGSGTYQKKVGETTTESSQTIASPQSKAAMADLKDANAIEQKAFQDEAKAKEEQIKLDADFKDKDAKATAIHANAVTTVMQRQQEERAREMQEYGDAVKRMASMQRDSFWGSKNAGDRVAASLSVGLGAFGQAMTGSGQNVGQMLLERQMNEFDKAQDQKFKQSLAAIDKMQISAAQKEQMRTQELKGLDAIKAAKYAQIAAEASKGMELAKVGPVKAALARQAANAQAKLAEKELETASKYDQEIKSRTQKDILEQTKLNAGMTKDGKPMNEGQAKALNFYAQMRGSMKNLEGMDEGTIAKHPEYIEALRQISMREQANAAGGISGMFANATESMKTFAGVTPEEELAKNYPAAYAYFKQTQPFVNGHLRSESGAAIGSPEFLRAYEQFFATPGDGPEQIKQKQQRRTERAKTEYMATGLP